MQKSPYTPNFTNARGDGQAASQAGRSSFLAWLHRQPLVPGRRLACALAVAAGITGCSSTGVNLGVSIPIGPHVGIGVGVGSDGRVSTGVGVSVGGGRVSVGTSGRLPNRAAAEQAAPASAPAPVTVTPQSKD